MRDVLIAGASSALAQALAARLCAQGDRVIGLCRDSRLRPNFEDIVQCAYTEAGLSRAVAHIQKRGYKPSLFVCCVGVLHDSLVVPEKRLADIQFYALEHYFAVNTIVPALLLKHIVSVLDANSEPRMAFLSAKVGSIEDNRLGGWYGYRASKAALNMLIKTSAIELARRYSGICVVAVHPGTTHSALSEPFVDRIPKGKIYSPQQSAERLCNVIDGLSAEDNGQFFHWDGSRLPW
ncbi:SDR family NAD(P)-dependent oxidoreductase [Gilvimarinus sp. SDUM040013]|uniref:SDR family NAD(P)-dependent oxidoreductase n=1 Tax=Gilvimarinus gilvus TaxID=3058038 RepID=A0ABU4RW36_9GAMM|nr:SDR family NAD(P)-dependent oxidoreductase [Gilvimarinus sp. SDUM040013]MDO3386511.1 SDR family NAD(P)-dependent oxidoreductase [Gilvimarinus sp. SDUM040013]MDX6849087.1 SDR family NAD(P)-dependent oxidoreductase [Gilvimarinus sp. SDUM040013]